MTALLQLLGAVIRSYPMIFANPILDGVYILVLILVAVRYSKIQSMEEQLYGKAKNKALHQTVMAIVLGATAGLLASILLVVVGVTVSEAGIRYLLPVALGLFFVHPRFLCFSYSGGLLSLSYLIFRWPVVHVPTITALVACLHAAEAVLIWWSGHTCATPLYFASEKEGTRGGFSLQRFWPIPLLALYIVGVPDAASLPGVIRLPDWWPLIKSAGVPVAGTPVFAMMPLVAALGYADIALSSTPRQKARQTSANLFLYSLLLLVFSVAASRLPPFAWVAAIFAPLAHEVVIKLGAKGELSGVPRYGSDSGVRVLDVFRGGLAQQAGFKSGDVILKARGSLVTGKEELIRALEEPGDITFLVKGTNGACRPVSITRESEMIGLIPAPDRWDEPMAMAGAPSPLAGILQRLARRFRA